jgi:putative hemolysin
MEILLVCLLILFNGVFVLSEIALVSSRKARLQQWANEGDAKARSALQLASEPRRFLSAIQIGITLVGILTGAFGGATVADSLARVLGRFPPLAPYANALGFGLVVLAITFLTLLFGELVPKRIGLAHPERIAVFTALPMRMLCWLAAPVSWVLNLSSDLALWLLRVKPSKEPPVTEEELKILIQQGTEAGTFEAAEQDMLNRVIRLGNRQVSALMTPRSEVVWFDIADPPSEIRRKIAGRFHARFPVGRGSLDDIAGVIQSKDLLAPSLSGELLDLKSALRPPLYLPEGTPALKALERFRHSPMHLALVVDEYGGFKGLVTLNDLLASIVGELDAAAEGQEPGVVRREDGSFLVDGMLPVDEFKEAFRIARLQGEEKSYFRTVGGFVMMRLGHIPKASDSFTWNGFRFEVVDMDGRRVDKVLVMPPPEILPGDGPEEGYGGGGDA